MKTILYFQSSSRTSAPEKLAGARSIIDAKGYHIQIIEEVPTKKLIKDLISFWNPVGAIIDCGNEYNEIDAKIFGGLRVVFLGHNPNTLPSGSLQVIHDQVTTSHLAAKELLSIGFRNFAFVPFFKNRTWSNQRQKAFCEALKLHGKKCHIFQATESDDTISILNALRNFILELPKPCGIFAANDKTAETIINAAQVTGIKIPSDISVIGVDNFELICEHTNPTLTSIEPDFKRGGELAALMLIENITSKSPSPNDNVLSFGPLRIVRRASSNLLKRYNPLVSSVLDLIRREACLGLTANRVASLFPCSRRMADIKFKKATGHTILEEIHARQLERAKQLLQNKSIPLKTISDFCGFTNPNSLRKFFRKETGVSMSAWRKNNALNTLALHDSQL